MARKIKASLTVAAATDGDDVLIGSNNSDAPDVIDGGAGNDYIDSFQGADTLIGGTGADTFKVHSWASSNVSTGVDTIMDFEAIDKIDLTNIRHYSEANVLVASSRAITMDDITITGNNVHVEVVAGDARWDIDIVVLGETPTVDNLILP